MLLRPAEGKDLYPVTVTLITVTSESPSQLQSLTPAPGATPANYSLPLQDIAAAQARKF